MLQALLDEDMYGRLQALRPQIEAADGTAPAHIFVPVGASPSQTSSLMPRLLFIGKATRGFGDDNLASFAGSRDRCIELLQELPSGRSGFWQFARAITQGVVQRLGQDASTADLTSFCGWSNVAKIGALEGNPSERSIALQAPLCIEALRMEIARFRPTGIVIAVTNYAEKQIVKPVFGADWSFDTPEEDRVAYKHQPGVGAVVWTNHPERMRPAGSRALVQSFAADLIARAMRGEALPPSAAS